MKASSRQCGGLITMSVELSRVDKRKKNGKLVPLKRKFSGRFKYVFKITLIVLLLAGLVSFGFYFGDGLLSGLMGESKMFSPVVADDEDPENSGALNKEGPVNILILGTDQRKNEPTRSDTLILATLYPKDKEVRLLSIPRDSKVPIRGHGTTKMGHAFAHGGKDLAVETVENLLGIPIDYFVETNFRGFKNIIDILGGVTLDVERRMYKPLEDIDLYPGHQTLNGYDSLAYVRWRDDAMGDIGRIERQGKFISALADQAMSISTVWKTPDLIKELRNNIRTDLGTREILYLGTKYAMMNSENLSSEYLHGEPLYENGVSYWELDEFELEKTVARLQTKTSDLPPEEENETGEGQEATPGELIK